MQKRPAQPVPPDRHHGGAVEPIVRQEELAAARLHPGRGAGGEGEAPVGADRPDAPAHDVPAHDVLPGPVPAERNGRQRSSGRLEAGG